MRWGAANTSFSCGAFCEAKYKFRRRPKRGRGGRGVWGNSASPEPKRSPAALLAKSRTQQKSFLFLLEKKSGGRKIKNIEKTFLRGGERQRVAAGRSVSFAQRNFAQSLEYPKNIKNIRAMRMFLIKYSKRVRGIEPLAPVWKTGVLPLYDTRILALLYLFP